MLTLRLDTTRSKRRLSAIFQRAGAKAIVSMAENLRNEILSETILGVEGRVSSLPERVDTGRYVAAWKSQLKVRPQGAGLKQSVRLENNTPYAADVEYGTATMAPGGHLRRAVNLARHKAPDRFKLLFQRAWKSA